MTEGGPGTPADVVTALRAVDGVADATITPDRRAGGAGTLHLSLQPGADEVAVATAVNRILREHFGLAVDTDNVSVVDETAPVRLSAVPSPPEEPPEVEQPMGEPLYATPSPAQSPPDPWAGYQPSDYGVESDDGAAQNPDDDAEQEGMGLGQGLGVSGLGGAEQESSRPWWWAAAEPVPDLGPDPQPGPGSQPGPSSDAAAQADRTVDLRTIDDQRGPRLLIERMQLVAADLGVQSEVTLQFGDLSWTGRADGAATPTSVHRSVAVATLRAIEECVGSGMRLELEHLETPALGSDRAVVVEISMVTRRGSERLIGISPIREDVRQAVIRATLDALNRRLESYLVSA